jgi:glc operon protein GlcG
MTHTKKWLAAAIAITCSAANAADAPHPTQYGPSLSLEQAHALIDASITAARKQNLNVVVAVVDTAGQLIALERMDNAQLGSLPVAQDKAVSASLYRRPTKEFEDLLSGGAMRILALRGAVPANGGIPIVIEGRVVGAIGVSGGTTDQDGAVAKAGVDTFNAHQAG